MRKLIRVGPLIALATSGAVASGVVAGHRGAAPGRAPEPLPPRITVVPARPVQGSVVRVLVAPARPTVAATQPARADSARSDSARGASAPADSTRGVPTPRDSTRADSARADSARGDSVRRDSASSDSARGDSARVGAAPDARDSIVGVGGQLAGEPLHFERDSAGTFEALGGVPVDARDSIPLRLEVRRADGASDTVVVYVRVAPGTFRMERLKVAPRYGRQPDSALAARIARESALAREVSRRSHDTPRLWRGEFVPPRQSEITSGFGHGRQFNGVVQSRHLGVDFRGDVGALVHATNRGVVALADTFFLGGRVVYVDHGAGLVTAYLHLSAAEVAVGDTVERGQVIGRVGQSGRVTGPHLHWVARYGGITVNPLSLLEFAGAQGGRRKEE